MGDSVIKVKPETKKMLSELKIHPRETYDDVIRRLIQCLKSTQSK